MKHNTFRKQLDMTWLYYAWSWLLNAELMKQIYHTFNKDK